MSPILLEKHFGVNNMKFVLSIFNERLLDFIQENIFDISSFISLIRESIFRPVQNNDMGLHRLEGDGKSLT